MALEWLPRDNEIKDHILIGSEHWGSEAPCTVYEKKPLTDPNGNPVEGLYVAWIRLNNPQQYNSYTTEMVKGVIAGFTAASQDRSVVAAVFTGTGDRAFCTGGNTREYAEYYARRPHEYGEYMDLFNGMVDSILNCKKPVICRVNGMRVAGGQEIGMACDIAVSSDLAIYGQAGARHGSSPDGGSTDFLPWFLSMEDAMWNCVSCELWSAYKMKAKNLISKVIPVLKKDGKFIRNPLIITDEYVKDGEIVYGEFKTGAAAKEAREMMKDIPIDFELLDKEVSRIVWTFANLFPGCLIKAIDGIRAKKKFFWDQSKLPNRHWLMANMGYEAFLGFNAFNTKKLTGKDVIDFIKLRQLIAQGSPMNANTYAEVFAKPQE
ncbi:6-oxocyclohex-1-ene-1-carbonyl-CoA hydratase [Desulfomonile tiedjei]|uniref:6-oxocyclohex-1-ene-1-carbonyl-CoA hydratase n=1 Tax=Desulfomonile tiedjei (strain ATCC 49306 / DSM 6799 / DCB-1) TaxID=706587 RepID=I4C3Q0_DESTA|nr:6-oxocyclohex-1-ene-1-carbonyl-CoA hydratase [Desulfomonile tiedjei]AFM24191.1 6-ketocyclohex-1-ene-1-carbonyl-CoA hydrolase [Desulfomonile tiedjei DSM 6799]